MSGRAPDKVEEAEQPPLTAGVGAPHPDHVAASRAHRLGRWGLLALPVVVLAERAWQMRWMADDGFIHLRVVSQLLAGNGPVFNAGERVEASTSPLWVYVLAAADLVAPFRIEWVAVLLGIALTLAGLGLAVAASVVLWGERDRTSLYVPVGALVLVAVAPVWRFASSGLEGGLISAWLGASCLVLARWARHDRRLPWWGAVVLGLGPLIRPDLGVFTVCFLGAVVIGRRHGEGWRDIARVLATALALPFAYQVFRMGYYGVLVPNPAIAKEAGGSRWRDGWRYLSQFVNPYGLWIPLLLLAGGAYTPMLRQLRRDGRARALLVVAAFLAAGLLHAMYIVRVGGDWMGARLLLPALVALTAPAAVVPLRRRYALALAVAPWALVSLLFLRSHDDRTVVANENNITTRDYEWGVRGSSRITVGDEDVFYNAVLLPDATPIGPRGEFASHAVGVSAFALGTDVHVLDLLGLADPFTAHLEIERRALPGHEKPLPAPWIVARATAPGSDLDEGDFPFLLILTSPLDDPGSDSFDARVATARETLACAEMRDFLAVYDRRLTPGRFVENLFGAFGNTTVRIPPEPRAAHARFCSDG